MISDNIIALRKSKGLNQEQLAEILGVSRQTVSKWENGESIPDIVKCSQMAEYFGVSLDDMATYEPDEFGLPIPPKGKYIFGVVKVGDKGQIVIPAKARKIFNISPGDSLIVLGDTNSGLAILSERDFLDMAKMIKEVGKEDD